MSLPDLKPGEGAVIETGGKKLAVYNDKGKLRAASAKCTHKGCTVAWNKADGTFDCPCHGSKFGSDFSVKHGPATEPLEPAELE